MDYFNEMKNRSTYSAIIAKHAYGKVWNFFLNLLHFSREELFIILSTSIKKTGRSIEEILISTLLYIFYISLDSLKKFKMYFGE